MCGQSRNNLSSHSSLFITAFPKFPGNFLRVPLEARNAYIKYRCILKINSSSIQSPESTLGMFLCQLLPGNQHFLSNCMASGCLCTFKADRSCGAQLLMERAYPCSHYCRRFARALGGASGAYKCVHSAANKEYGSVALEHLLSVRIETGACK